MIEILQDRRIVLTAAGILLLFGLIATLIVYGGKTTAYAVKADNKVLFIARDAEAVKQQITSIEASEAKRIGHKVVLSEDITYSRVLVKEEEITNPSKTASLLKKNLCMQSSACCIKVNGQSAVYVASQSVAKKLLAYLKQQNTVCEDFEKVKKVGFAEKVVISQADVPSTRISSYEEALTLLQTGDKSPVHYIVKSGDSLWTIARRNDMHVADLMAANNLTSDKLALDQKLVITTSRPLVNVVSTIEGVKKETIPYETKVVVDKSQSYGVRQKQKGQDGEKKVAYIITRKNGTTIEKKIVTEKIITKPVDEILVRGKRTSAVMVASRGSSRFAGVFSWPAWGHITSYFGSHRGHTGIDIDGDTGDPIRAAGAGVVTYAGRSGGYGLHIYIDHGNGMKTHYAHCSKLLVSQGQRVTKGQMIAKMGSTGHSTGSHLHFEVINGGGFHNPTNYLK